CARVGDYDDAMDYW
nr:immunoglobulin heavy chain junction region [Mus musculus]